MNYSTQIPLFQWVNGSLQPNPDLVSGSKPFAVKQKGKKTPTKEIQKLTQLPRHQLPKIGECLIFQSYIISHQGKNDWKIYQEKDINH